MYWVDGGERESKTPLFRGTHTQRERSDAQPARVGGVVWGAAAEDNDAGSDGNERTRSSV